MQRLQPKSTGAKHWRVIVGLLCVALVVLAGTLSVSHGHDDSISHTDCGLCATAHAPVQLAASPALVSVAQVFASVEPGLPEAAPRRFPEAALFTRPPPPNAHLTF